VSLRERSPRCSQRAWTPCVVRDGDGIARHVARPTPRGRARAVDTGAPHRNVNRFPHWSLHAQRIHASASRRRHRLAAAAAAQDTKVAIGISGWTGFAPLTLAKEAGIFKKNGLDVELKKIPQSSRHLAIASRRRSVRGHHSGDVGRVERQRRRDTQIFQLDKSYGADGLVVRNSVGKIADLKGKTVAASAPGTAPYFTLAWFLKKNGLSVKGRHRRESRAGSRRAGVRRRQTTPL
jgi:hypothetical protein